MRDIGPAVRRAWSRAVDRVRTDGFLLVQQAAAATVAWVLATYVVNHNQPFFAPVAAVVALNAPLGERGGNTLRLLQGVVIGILAGELALGIFGATSATEAEEDEREVLAPAIRNLAAEARELAKNPGDRGGASAGGR